MQIDLRGDLQPLRLLWTRQPGWNSKDMSLVGPHGHLTNSKCKVNLVCFFILSLYFSPVSAQLMEQGNPEASSTGKAAHCMLHTVIRRRQRSVNRGQGELEWKNE